MPWPGIGTHRSRGIESSVACLDVGSTRTRIIDWVFSRSGGNLESSSEPSSSTVNGCVGAFTGFRFGIAAGPVVEVAAVWKTGRKYAPSPPRPASTNPSATIQARVIRASGPPPQQRLNAAKNPCQVAARRWNLDEGPRPDDRGRARAGQRDVAADGAASAPRRVQLQPAD